MTCPSLSNVYAGHKVHVHEDATTGESHVVGIPIEVAMATSEVIHRGGEDEDVPRLTKLNMVLGLRQGEPQAVVLEQDDYGVGVKATPVVVAVSDARPGLSGLVEALVLVAGVQELHAPPMRPTAPQEATLKPLLYKFNKGINLWGEPQAMCMAFLRRPQKPLTHSVL